MTVINSYTLNVYELSASKRLHAVRGKRKKRIGREGGFGIIKRSVSESHPPLSELYSPSVSLTFPPVDRRDECVPR